MKYIFIQEDYNSSVNPWCFTATAILTVLVAFIIASSKM